MNPTLDNYFILGIEDGSWKLYGTANNIGTAAEAAKGIASTLPSVRRVIIAQPTHQAEVKLVRDVVVLPTRLEGTLPEAEIIKEIILPETPELSRDYKDPLIPLDYRPGKPLSCCHYHNTGGPPSAHCGGERFR